MAPEALFPTAPAEQPPSGRRTNWKPWIIAIVVVAVLLCGGCGALVFAEVNSLHPSTASAPRDFPVYPGAQQQSAFAMRPNDRVGTVATVQWTTTDKSDQVLAFYRSELAVGPWRATGERKITSVITQFEVIHTGTVAVETGRLQVQGILSQTQIQLSITSGGGSRFPTPLRT